MTISIQDTQSSATIVIQTRPGFFVSGDTGGSTGTTYSRTWDLVSSSAILTAGQSVATDTSGGAFTVTLPAAPGDGDAISLSVIVGDPETNPLTIAGNGKMIGGNGFSSDSELIIDVPLPYIELAYFEAVGEWKIVDQAGEPSPGTGATLDDLTDVVVTSPDDGEGLIWDSATSKFVNGSITYTGEISGITGLQTALDGKAPIAQAVPSGGTTDQVLAKVDGTNYNVTWVDAAIGAGDMAAATYDPQSIAGDAFARANHTGAQAISTVTGLQTALDAKQAEPAEGAFVDGDKTKLDGIEAGADVTDTTNVTAAGALMDSEVTNLADVKAFDKTDFPLTDPTGVTGADKVTNIISLTQAEYDAITPNASTLYVITA